MDNTPWGCYNLFGDIMDNCKKIKKRTDEEKKYFKKRLRIIEGQINGITKMIEEDKYCSDILVQLLAVNKSIKGISVELLKSHLSTCVVDDIKNGQTEIIDEVMDLIKRLN